MRLRTDFWVAAYIRRCELEGAFAVLRRRGAPEAGAIFIKIDNLSGCSALYGPAPQSELKDSHERIFERLHSAPWIAPAEAEQKLLKQIRFDPDIWIIETEDRQGRSFLDVVA
ncbi:MAG: DUF1491 family protein [Methylocapsa sp.]|nr:DUF1491 family protein [Methylocapsa sp.]